MLRFRANDERGNIMDYKKLADINEGLVFGAEKPDESSQNLNNILLKIYFHLFHASMEMETSHEIEPIMKDKIEEMLESIRNRLKNSGVSEQQFNHFLEAYQTK